MILPYTLNVHVQQGVWGADIFGAEDRDDDGGNAAPGSFDLFRRGRVAEPRERRPHRLNSGPTFTGTPSRRSSQPLS